MKKKKEMELTISQFVFINYNYNLIHKTKYVIYFKFNFFFR